MSLDKIIALYKDAERQAVLDTLRAELESEEPNLYVIEICHEKLRAKERAIA